MLNTKETSYFSVIDVFANRQTTYINHVEAIIEISLATYDVVIGFGSHR